MLTDINMLFIKQFLPPEATLLCLDEPNKRHAVISADLDGDNTQEIAAAYRWHENNGIVVLKWFDGYWQPISYIDGKGYGITYFNAAPITGEKAQNLVIGWQLGAIYSQLDILKWTNESFKSLLQNEINFSEIEVANISTKEGMDKKFEIALWTHDTGDAYVVDVYQWNGEELKSYPEAYPNYFRKVADYYNKQVIKFPDAAFYWYYLADAQDKSEHYNKALKSIETAIKLNSPYPSIETLRNLLDDILSKINNNLYLYPASLKTIHGTKWGYINKDGAFIIKPQFDNAMDFQDNGLAIVEKGTLSGIIDRYGRYIVPLKYSSITQFSEGRASVIDDSGFKVIDTKGQIITPKSYSYIGMYQNTRAVVNHTNDQGISLYGYLDREGREAIPIQYMTASDFKNDQAVVQMKDNQFAFIGLDGENLYTYNYASVNNLGEGLLSFQPEANSKFGYIDVKGNVVIEPKFSAASAFSNERAVVNTASDYSNKYGLIDKEGNFIIEPIYNDLNPIGADRIAVGVAINPEQPYIGSIYAIADILSGELLTEFNYTNITNYSKGYVSVSDDSNTFFLDKNGDVAKALPVVKGSGTLSFVGDLIKADIDYRVYYLNRSGKVVKQQNTVLPLNNQYKIIEEKYNPDKNYIVYYPKISGIANENIQKHINEQLKSLSQVKSIEDQVPLDYNYSGDYSIEFFKKYLLGLELDSYQYYFGAAHGMPTQIHPNINLISGQFYQLKDLFMADSSYIKVLSDIIAEQIKNDPQYNYIFLDEYKGIAENQPFYVKEDALYIYFSPYEIAPYAAGFPTFRIPYTEIMSIINTQGEFWRSYH
ncbi:MAG: repeat-containing protein [Clostridia bacterium]|nr:repeat-containing protein [Clostridia bacterium]